MATSVLGKLLRAGVAKFMGQCWTRRTVLGCQSTLASEGSTCDGHDVILLPSEGVGGQDVGPKGQRRDGGTRSDGPTDRWLGVAGHVCTAPFVLVHVRFWRAACAREAPARMVRMSAGFASVLRPRDRLEQVMTEDAV